MSLHEEHEKRKRFARLVHRILREGRITEKDLTRRLKWSPDRVSDLLKGEMPLDRGIKVEVAQALGLTPIQEARQKPRQPGSSPFEALTDEEVDSLFETDLPSSYKY